MYVLCNVVLKLQITQTLSAVSSLPFRDQKYHLKGKRYHICFLFILVRISLSILNNPCFFVLQEVDLIFSTCLERQTAIQVNSTSQLNLQFWSKNIYFPQMLFQHFASLKLSPVSGQRFTSSRPRKSCLSQNIFTENLTNPVLCNLQLPFLQVLSPKIRLILRKWSQYRLSASKSIVMMHI